MARLGEARLGESIQWHGEAIAARTSTEEVDINMDNLITEIVPHGREIEVTEIQRLLRRMAKGGLPVDEAVLGFPLGEMVNGCIDGFLWAWALRGILRLQPLPWGTKRSMIGTTKQGIEPMVAVRDDLSTCLLAWKQLPEHRRILWHASGCK